MKNENQIIEMSYTFYKYLSIYKQPQTERSLDYDNLVTIFKDFEYLTSDSFFKEIFSHVKYGTKKAKEVLDEFRNKKLDTTEQLKEHFSKLIDEMNDFGSDYHKFVKELVIGIARTKDIIDVYDPTFGTADFLVEASRRLNVHNFYGEEIDFTMFNIGKMNMFINNVNPENIHFKFTNTILYSKFKEHRFDLIINEQPIEPISIIPKSLLFDIRFSSLYQTSIRSISDYSFIFHGLHLLKENGLFVTIVTPNLIFKELNRDIRKKIIEENNHLDTIIKLPKSLSSSYNMAMHILVFKKNRLRNEKVFFMDYSQEQYTTNKLRNDILSTYINKVELEGKSRYVDLDEIKENNYNLNVSRYIKKVDLYVRKETYELLEDIKRLEKERNEKQTNIENIINKLL